MRAGGLDPATPVGQGAFVGGTVAFNEGRGVRPGNTNAALAAARQLAVVQ